MILSNFIYFPSKLYNKKVILYSLLFLVLVLGFFIRIYFSSYHDGVTDDAEAYLNASKGVFDSSVPFSYNPNRPGGKFIPQPLYPIFTAIVSLFTNDTLFSGQFVSLLSGGLLILLSFFSGKLLFKDTIGLFSAFIASIYNVLIWNSLHIATESLYTFIFILIIIVLYKSLITHRLVLFFVSGITIGFGFLCRSFGLINLFIAIFLIIIIYRWFQHSIKHTLQKIILLLTGFLLVTFAYFIYLRIELGTWTLGHQFTLTSQKYEKVYENKSIYIKGYAHEKVTYEVKDHSNYISFMISELAHGYLIQYYRMIRKGDSLISIFPLVFIILIIAGIIYNKHENSKIVNLILIFFLLSLPFFLPLLKVTNRYLSPIVPIGILYLSAAVFYITQNITNRLRSNYLKLIRSKWFWYSTFLSFVFLINLPGLMDPVRKKTQFPKNYRHIGEWLKEYSPGNDFIISNSLIYVYSDDYNIIIKQNTSFQQIFESAKKKNVKFLIVEDNVFQAHPKITIDDLSENDLSKLIFLKEFNQPGNFKIYQFKY